MKDIGLVITECKFVIANECLTLYVYIYLRQCCVHIILYITVVTMPLKETKISAYNEQYYAENKQVVVYFILYSKAF